MIFVPRQVGGNYLRLRPLYYLGGHTYSTHMYVYKIILVYELFIIIHHVENGMTESTVGAQEGSWSRHSDHKSINKVKLISLAFRSRLLFGI